uniref:Uncharacterized protein n=1 Tax=Plectus sambesii TaxID=2011161 RepID=A0A914UWU4_9BILA
MRGRVNSLVVLILLAATLGSHCKRVRKSTDKLSELAAHQRQRETTVDPFDETAMMQRSEQWYSKMRAKEPRRLVQYVAKLGKIALYLRMYKRYGRNPQSNERRFLHQFPNPTIRQLDAAVQSACVDSVQNCVDTIYERVRHSYIFSIFSNRNLSGIHTSSGPSLTEEAYAKLSNSDASF